jgi:hypothetical protein
MLGLRKESKDAFDISSWEHFVNVHHVLATESSSEAIPRVRCPIVYVVLYEASSLYHTLGVHVRL